MADVPKINGFSAKYAELCMNTLLETRENYPVASDSTVYLSTQEQDFDINFVGVPVGFVPYQLHNNGFYSTGFEYRYYYNLNTYDFEFPIALTSYGIIISTFVIPVGVDFTQEWGGTLTESVRIYQGQIAAFLARDFRLGFLKE